MTQIYKLKDSFNNIKYIGKTIQPLKKRLSAHITKAKRQRITHTDCWIYSLLLKGEKPVIELIELTDDWENREKYWISYYGIENLCNHKPGGQYGTMRPLSDEHKKKLSIALMGKKRPIDVRNKISIAHKGKKLKQSTKDKLRIFNTGKKQSLATKLKKSKGSILQCDMNNNIIAEYLTMKIAADVTGFWKGNISSACTKRLKTYKGFIWKFKNEDIVDS
jgi:hypothetical protein